MKKQTDLKIVRETKHAIDSIPHYIKCVNSAIYEAKNYEHSNAKFEILEWSDTPTTHFSDVIEPVLVHYLTACGYKVYVNDGPQTVNDDYPDVPNGTYYFRTLDIYWRDPITGRDPV